MVSIFSANQFIEFFRPDLEGFDFGCKKSGISYNFKQRKTQQFWHTLNLIESYFFLKQSEEDSFVLSTTFKDRKCLFLVRHMKGIKLG